MVRCARTAPSARLPGSMPATCSSAPPCKSICKEILRPSRPHALLASAARRIWAPTRGDAAIRASPGYKRARRPIPTARHLCGEAASWWSDRIAGFGGAPNMGSDARGRRHPSEPWLQAGKEADPDGPAPLRRGRKLVVQIGETFGDKNVPLFVEKLDALALAEKMN